MKKSILTILALSMILITTSSNVVLGSEQKHVSFLSSIERVESIQEKKELYNKHLALIDNANQNLSEAEKQLNDTSIEQAQKAINEVPRLFQGKLLDRLNKAKDSKLALEEKRRLEEEAAALAAKEKANKNKITEQESQPKTASQKDIKKSDKNKSIGKKQEKGVKSNTQTTIPNKESQSSPTKKGNVAKDIKKTNEGRIVHGDTGEDMGASFESGTFIWDE